MKISMKTMRSSFFIFFCLVTFRLVAQELIPIGTWRSHFNYEQVTLVEKTSTKVFAASAQGLTFFDTEDQSINKLTKVDGLSDVGITAISYNEQEEYLALGYRNGNFDLISSDGIQNLPVLLSSDVTESKTVNHISFYHSKINLSTDFGLLVLTTDNKVEEAYLNLSETGQTISVHQSVIHNDIMYLATADGVLSGNLTSGDNLQDFNNWERFTGSSVYLVDIISIALTNGHIYASSSAELYRLANGTWSNIPLTMVADEQILKIRAGLSGLLVLTNQRIFILNSSDVFSEISKPAGAIVNDLIQETENSFWYADGAAGLTRLAGGAVEHLVLAGPLNTVKKMKIVEEEIYALPAFDIDFSNPLNNGLGYSIFMGGVWETITPDGISGFSNLTDVFSYNDQILLSSFGQGILNLQTQQTTNFSNSPLQENETGTGNTLVSGIVVDSDQRIWLSNFSNYSLLQWDGTDAWDRFDFGSSAAMEPTELKINRNDQIWMILGLIDGRGVLAYDIESGLSRYLTTTADGLPSNRVHDIAFGKEDEIWFATDNGVANFPFSLGVIEDQSIDLSLPVYEDNVLFENKPVYAVEVDEGNRIWMGTAEGLWLFEENVNELIHHFHVDNSPLPSNTILDLAIEPRTGELFVVTDQGVVSYRTNASQATETHREVKIFPNPVPPGYEGWVGFSGLVNNARLKITTAAGRIVREINAAGGGASWDLNDYSGRRVATGVYLVFSASRDGSETFVGKIAIVN